MAAKRVLLTEQDVVPSLKGARARPASMSTSWPLTRSLQDA